MRRRQFLGVLGGAIFARPDETLAQKAPVRIGFLTSGAAASINSAYQVKAIKRGLESSGLLKAAITSSNHDSREGAMSSFRRWRTSSLKPA
jgi:hypothetical protein